MEKEEREGLLKSLPVVYRVIYEICSQGTKKTADIRRVTQRADGMTTELRKLQTLGLLREMGTFPMSYRSVPDRDVERQSELYVATQRQQSAKGKRRKPQRALRELPKDQLGNFDEWLWKRKRLVELSMVVTGMEPMTFWECVPLGDVDIAAEAVEELAGYCEQLLSAFVERHSEAALEEKIEKLLRSNGRYPEEMVNAKRLAARQQRKLDHMRKVRL